LSVSGEGKQLLSLKINLIFEIGKQRPRMNAAAVLIAIDLVRSLTALPLASRSQSRSHLRSPLQLPSHSVTQLRSRWRSVTQSDWATDADYVCPSASHSDAPAAWGSFLRVTEPPLRPADCWWTKLRLFFDPSRCQSAVVAFGLAACSADFAVDLLARCAPRLFAPSQTCLMTKMRPPSR
jgi:hypothetical protein